MCGAIGRDSARGRQGRSNVRAQGLSLSHRSGPIGVLVVASERLAGASAIVVTDLFDEALTIAKPNGRHGRGQCQDQ